MVCLDLMKFEENSAQNTKSYNIIQHGIMWYVDLTPVQSQMHCLIGVIYLRTSLCKVR